MKKPYVERRTVSRKTPNDGKLEITAVAARRLSAGPIRLDIDGQPGDATLGSMPCTCRGAEKPHVHYFIESPLFRTLMPNEGVDVHIAAGGSSVTVERDAAP